MHVSVIGSVYEYEATRHKTIIQGGQEDCADEVTANACGGITSQRVKRNYYFGRASGMKGRDTRQKTWKKGWLIFTETPFRVHIERLAKDCRLRSVAIIGSARPDQIREIFICLHEYWT